MKITKHLALVFFLTITSISLSNIAQAQRRVGRGRVVIVQRPYHRVVVRNAHYRYNTLPRWGVSVNVRPANAVFISGRGHNYYHNNGIYYTQRNNNYIVVRPARGLRIRTLPIGYRPIVIGPRNYYYYYGTYYVKSANDYVVVNPPLGALIDALPNGYEVKSVDGNEYYYLDGVYYAEVDATEFQDGVGYQVVDFN
jgi:hypothetical protein